MVVLDQTLLPWEERFLVLRDEYQVYEAIARLRVRGAPAIGVAAAYGLYVAFRRKAVQRDFKPDEASRVFHGIKDMLCSSRPTAVNLSAALERMGGMLRFSFRASPGAGIGSPACRSGVD